MRSMLKPTLQWTARGSATERTNVAKRNLREAIFFLIYLSWSFDDYEKGLRVNL